MGGCIRSKRTWQGVGVGFSGCTGRKCCRRYRHIARPCRAVPQRFHGDFWDVLSVSGITPIAPSPPAASTAETAVPSLAASAFCSRSAIEVNAEFSGTVASRARIGFRSTYAIAVSTAASSSSAWLSFAPFLPPGKRCRRCTRSIGSGVGIWIRR